MNEKETEPKIHDILEPVLFTKIVQQNLGKSDAGAILPLFKYLAPQIPINTNNTFNNKDTEPIITVKEPINMNNSIHYVVVRLVLSACVMYN